MFVATLGYQNTTELREYTYSIVMELLVDICEVTVQARHRSNEKAPIEIFDLCSGSNLTLICEPNGRQQKWRGRTCANNL